MEDGTLTLIMEHPVRLSQEDDALGIHRWTWRPGEGLLDWSAGVSVLLGEPPDQPGSWDTWLKHVHPQDAGAVRRSLDPGVHESKRLTYRIWLAGGGVELIEDRRHRLPDGRWSGVFIRLGPSQEQTVELEAQRYADKVMTIAGIAILFHDFRSGDEWSSKTLGSLLGIDRTGTPMRYDALADLVHPDDLDVFRRMVTDGRRDGGLFDLDYRIITPHGDIRWVRERGQYEHTAGGELICYYGSVRDITAELNDSRMRLKLALEANAVAVWEYNALTDEPYWSDEFYRLLGYEPRSLPPSPEAWFAVIHPDDRARAEAHLQDMMVETEVAELIYRVISNGCERWLRETWRWAIDPLSGARICHGLTADITAWKLKEQRLSEAEKWLELAVDAADLGIWEHDLDTGEFLWNEQMFLLLEYVPGVTEATSETWIARIHPDDRPKVKARLQSARYNRRDFTLEYRLLLPGNVIRWVEERGRITIRGQSARHHGVLFDVSQRKALELRLVESSERLQLALEAGEMGFWSGGAHDQNWDRRTYRIQGLDPLSVRATARNAFRLVHPEDRDYFRATIARAKATEDVVAAEYRIIRPDGVVRWVEGRFCIGEASALGRYGVLRDITDRKAREEYYLQSQRLEAAGQLLGGIVHDFNNLLAVIAATLERVERHSTSPEMVQQLAHAREATLAGGLFNRRLVNLSQLRRQQPRPLDIAACITAIMGALTSVIRPGIEVSVQFPDDLWQALADPLDLESAVINLVINARDAMKDDGRITISARNEVLPPNALPDATSAGEYVVLTVQDTGCGMDQETLARAREPFFSTKPEGAGTGLGLTSVSAFATRSHGNLSIASVPGEGTSVSLSIPRAQADLPAASQGDGHMPMGDGELVLVVDDDPAVREVTMQRVEALGYAVEAAACAGDAITKLLSVPSIALVLTDIAMPGDLNGFGLRDWVAAEMPLLPVVLISAHEHALSLCSDEARVGRTLAKSCSRRELAQALAGALAAG